MKKLLPLSVVLFLVLFFVSQSKAQENPLPKTIYKINPAQHLQSPASELKQLPRNDKTSVYSCETDKQKKTMTVTRGADPATQTKETYTIKEDKK
jgi:hypothetical protein